MSSTPTLRGKVRRLPATFFVRLLQALSLWLFLAGAWRVLSSLLLGARHVFELRANGRELVLDRRYSIFGRPLRRWRTVLPLDGIEEVTLQVRGEPATFSAGLFAMVLGTFFGGRFLVEGARAPGGAPSLLLIAVVLVLVGIGLDYLWGSGRSPQTTEGQPQLVLRARGERGWVLSGMTRDEAEHFLSAIERALKNQGGVARLSDSSGEPSSAPSAASEAEAPSGA